MGAPYLKEMWESDAAKKHVNKPGAHFQLRVPPVPSLRGPGKASPCPRHDQPGAPYLEEMWESDEVN